MISFWVKHFNESRNNNNWYSFIPHVISFEKIFTGSILVKYSFFTYAKMHLKLLLAQCYVWLFVLLQVLQQICSIIFILEFVKFVVFLLFFLFAVTSWEKKSKIYILPDFNVFEIDCVTNCFAYFKPTLHSLMINKWTYDSIFLL